MGYGKYDKFEYHLEDLSCEYCLHNKKKGKGKSHGCGDANCRYSAIRADAAANGRVERERGWNKWDV